MVILPKTVRWVLDAVIYFQNHAIYWFNIYLTNSNSLNDPASGIKNKSYTAM